MTSDIPTTTGTDGPAPTPPPGCPAHGLDTGGLRRLHGPQPLDLRSLYEELRAEHGPVAPVLLHDDVPIWVVLGHAENLRLVNTPAVFSRDSRIWTPLLDGRVKPDHPLMPHIAWQPICSHAEGDEHRRLRSAVTSAMSPINHRIMRRSIYRHAQALVNKFCERGEADLVSQYSEHLPMAVMCDLLGMPKEYNDRIVHAARDMLKGTETAIASNAYIMEALARLTARRRAEPDEDIAGLLVTHEAGLTDDEIREHLRVVLIAAYEATANLLANALRMVLTHPGFRAQLNGGQMTVAQAVEQSLWDEPPFSTVFAYFAKQDTELGGRQIRKGDGLLFAPAPGNVDPRIRPDLKASMMGNRSHLAFGGGPHECPGQNIGRVIADVGVDAMLRRLPDVQLDCEEDELQWRESIASRHLVELPVRFEPRPQQDIDQMPSHTPNPPKGPAWEPLPAEPLPEELPSAELPPGELPPAEPEPATPPEPDPASASAAAPASDPASASASAPEPEPDRKPGAWQRLLRWWRGY